MSTPDRMIADTVKIGWKMHLEAVIVGGGSNAYLEDKHWDVGTDTAFRSATLLPKGEVTPLGGTDIDDQGIIYYYVRPDTLQVVFTATLKEHANDPGVQVGASANYLVWGPTNVVMNTETIDSGVSIGHFAYDSLGTTVIDTTHTTLRFGQAAFGPSAGLDSTGIRFMFSATEPDTIKGYVAGVQLVNVITYSWPWGYVGENSYGDWYLDGCPLYQHASTSSNGTFEWKTPSGYWVNQSPYTLLMDNDSLKAFGAYFKMHFMYRPPGRASGDSSSIWVPIGKLSWFFEGIAENIATYPNVNWRLNHNDWAVDPVGTDSLDYPVWFQTANYRPNCPSMPPVWP